MRKYNEFLKESGDVLVEKGFAIRNRNSDISIKSSATNEKIVNLYTDLKMNIGLLKNEEQLKQMNLDKNYIYRTLDSIMLEMNKIINK